MKLLHRRRRGVEIALSLLENLLGDEAGLHQFLSALEVRLGELERALARGDFGFCGRERVLGVSARRLCAARNCASYSGEEMRAITCPCVTDEPSSTVTSSSRPAYFDETSTCVASMRPFDLTTPSGNCEPRNFAMRFLIGPARAPAQRIAAWQRVRPGRAQARQRQVQCSRGSFEFRASCSWGALQPTLSDPRPEPSGGLTAGWERWFLVRR